MKGNQRRFLAVVAAACVMFASFTIAEANQEKATGEEVVVTGYAREMPPGVVMGVAYLSLHNPTQRPRALRAVELPRHPEASAALHATVNEDGVSRMRPLQEVTLDAGGVLEMQPGATHLMLHGVRLRAGESLQLRLVFADGATQQITVPVRAMVTAQHESHDTHRHHGG
ncbi:MULTISPECIES: copper chaperone PCu(A)C [Microbulbifer]|uniref:Copper chaperone PCu(A)C n=1 Tax=Microbulbifer celer TaxID=435905 RepID=A0ABW3U5C1_9GAMM|nr:MULTISPECIES: copper chaperone PCu(A)C [Microbulbifer]UFN56551.1 copper chaperone PCu(A)C [Microbulbifer celer]